MLDDFTKVDLVKTIDLEDRAWEDNARPCLGKYYTILPWILIHNLVLLNGAMNLPERMLCDIEWGDDIQTCLVRGCTALI